MKNSGGSSFFRFPDGENPAEGAEQNTFGAGGEDEDLYN
jgi:transitional endoplasmic reticulum ATPase